MLLIFMLVQKKKKKKLDDKSIKCIFVGCSNKIKGFILYDPITKKVITSHNVIFNKKKFETLR